MKVRQYDELQKIKEALVSIHERCRSIEAELGSNLSASAVSVAADNVEMARAYITDALDENR